MQFCLSVMKPCASFNCLFIYFIAMYIYTYLLLTIRVDRTKTDLDGHNFFKKSSRKGDRDGEGKRFLLSVSGLKLIGPGLEEIIYSIYLNKTQKSHTSPSAAVCFHQAYGENKSGRCLDKSQMPQI